MRGAGYIRLPDALGRKSRAAVHDWRWAWLFPSRREYVDRQTRHRLRQHVYATTIQRAIARAAAESKINRRVTAHTFRHSFATHLLQSGTDVRLVQELLGHRDLATTMVYLHVLERDVGVQSPLDLMQRSDPVTRASPDH